MEIEVTGLDKILAKKNALLAAGLAFIGLLVIMAVIGRVYSPVNDGGVPAVLTLSEWQILKAERAYQTELAELQRDVEQMASMLDRAPDPVRAQINAERIARKYAEGQPALAHHRQVVVTAAQWVGDWAAGAALFNDARSAVEQAIAVLQPQKSNSAPDHQSFLPLTVRDQAAGPAAGVEIVQPYPAPGMDVRAHP